MIASPTQTRQPQRSKTGKWLARAALLAYSAALIFLALRFGDLVGIWMGMSWLRGGRARILLADRAGATFASVATGDDGAALALQERLANGFRMDDFFPPASDLPEGIPDAELQESYGGVGGLEYQRIAAEIEHRVASCPAYR